ncbi:tetratricopeptide repeat protein [uncultured Ruminococcus sp.]|uniref:SEL1-like repeat protein n=1 Tax=uncultured Ruminococcus sp. TaxID=165186 RepID=UPI0025FFD0A5|nr:tetratricopeptide repeat protein [uncultured Ruminococcus sp.]
MTIPEAKIICNQFFDKNGCYTEEDFFLYTEATQYLIRETQNPRHMYNLAIAYEWRKEYELAYKYFQMAADQGYADAYLGLGYIWYYGRTGKTDYEKAFYWFSKCGNDLNAQYKIADMYHNGYYVEKDEEKYQEIIERLYHDYYHTTDDWNDASLGIRLAKIRTKQGKTKEAIQLLLEAKESLMWCISKNAFFGSYSLMQGLIDKLYRLQPLDTNELDLFDLYELLKKPVKVQFTYGNSKHHIESSEEEDGTIAVCFDGKWYHNINEMMMNARINGELISQDPWSVEDIEVI